MTGTPSSSSVQRTRRVSTTFTHSAAPDDISRGGVSFLDLLLKRFPYHSELEWRERIRDGRVTLQGNVSPPETQISRGDLITYHVTDYEEPAVPLDFKEVVAQGDLALVHKPAGMPVHKTGKVFVNVLANLYRAFKGDNAWTPLNRLDVETSGIVAFARGVEALRRFAPAHQDCQWTKTYLAVVDGILEGPTIHDGLIAEWREHPIRSRMRVYPEGKSARTQFQPLATRDGKTLILAKPVTGRKHQIRVHLADLGFPIVGDKVYNHEGRFYLKRLEGELDEADIETLGAPHQLLHALSLQIVYNASEDSEQKSKRVDLGGKTDGGPQGGGEGERETSGISGTDFNLPADFGRYFPELSEEWLREQLAKA